MKKTISPFLTISICAICFFSLFIVSSFTQAATEILDRQISQSPGDEGIFSKNDAFAWGDSIFNNAAIQASMTEQDYNFMASYLRWTTTTIPQGATIGANTYISVKASNSCNAGDTIRIHGFLETDVDRFLDLATAESYATTTAYTEWTLPTWSQNSWYNSPSLQDEIQEIVNQADWSSGNHLGVKIYQSSAASVGDKSFYCYEATGQDQGAKLHIEYTIGPDTTSPGRDNAQPTGSLLAGTTQTDISLTTNETANCRYSTIAGVSYDEMLNTFSVTDDISHSTLITGLTDGNSYTYYVKCSDTSGNKNIDDFLIQFSVSPPSEYPKLYFTSEDLSQLKVLKTASSHQAIWNNIQSWAAAHVSDLPPAEPTDDWNEWMDTAADIRKHLEIMGFMYAMTNDANYADAAKDWMLSVSGWSAWGTGESKQIAQCSIRIILGVSFGYDILHDYLISLERDTIRQAIITHTDFVYQLPVYTDYPNMGSRAGAVGIAALVLEDEYSGANNWLTYAIDGAQSFLSYGGQDGGWFEGLSYGPYSMGLLMPFFDAFKRVKSQDLFTDNDFLQNHAYYYIYFTYNGRPLQFEDCNWHEGYNPDAITFIYKLAFEFNDGYAQQFANTHASQSMMQSYIWKKPDLVPVSFNNLPLTRHFSDTGYVISRAGWGNYDLLFAFKSGSSRGHAHNSQNEFQIYNNGKTITPGPGYVAADPRDDTWSHNSLLVDELDQCQEPGDFASCPLGTRGQISAVEVIETNYVYMLGDASAVYTGASGVGELDKWLRHVIFAQNPNYFVMYDDVAASSPKQFDWLLHCKSISSENYNLSIADDLITLEKSGGIPVDTSVKLQTAILEPESFAYEILHFDMLWGRDYDYIKVHPSVNTAQTKFLTVHFPLEPAESALPTEKVSIGNVIGTKVTNGNDLDLILFSSDGNPVDQYIELEDYYEAADGQSYTFNGTQVRAQFSTYQVMRLILGEPPSVIPGDISGPTAGVPDNKVDLYDVSYLLSRWGSINPIDLTVADINPGPSNISQDKIDLYDANLIMKNWSL